MIPAGGPAPDATVFLAPKQPVRLNELFGDGTAVLLFFPLAFSSTCTEEMCTMSDDLTIYSDLGAKVFGISVDSPYVNVKFAESTGATFPILSDFNREAMTAYDIVRVVNGLQGVSERAVFIIAKGVVRYAWVGEHPGVMPSFTAIQDALKAL
jgi:glutaredoxin-dependent peroxiredoxin